MVYGKLGNEGTIFRPPSNQGKSATARRQLEKNCLIWPSSMNRKNLTNKAKPSGEETARRPAPEAKSHLPLSWCRDRPLRQDPPSSDGEAACREHAGPRAMHPENSGIPGTPAVPEESDGQHPQPEAPPFPIQHRIGHSVPEGSLYQTTFAPLVKLVVGNSQNKLH